MQDIKYVKKDILQTCADKNILQTVFGLIKAMIEEKDLYSLLQQIHDQIKQVIHVDRCTIFIYDRKTNELWSRLTSDLEVKEIRLSIGKGIAGRVADQKRIMIVNDVEDFPFFDPSWDQKTGYQTESILAVPMISRGSELVGVIEAINKQNGDFDNNDGDLLMAFASLAATAIRDVERDIERERFIESVVRSFSETIDARSEFTAGHSRKVAAYAKNFALALRLNKIETKILYYAALLHDVGKIGIKDSILEKPGRLTPDEYENIKEHVAYTRNILNAIEFPEDLKEIQDIAVTHHEQFDGYGYPFGLKGHQIHKLTKMLSILDVFESLTSCDRPYRRAIETQKAIDVLLEKRGTYFDPQLVDLFIEKRIYQTELRMHKRINVDLAIEFVLSTNGCVKGKEITKGRVLNISRGGILFSSNIAFPFHKLVELTVYIPDDKIEAMAQVTRCKEIKPTKKFQVGLRFVDLSIENQKKLQKYFQNFPM